MNTPRQLPALVLFAALVGHPGVRAATVTQQPCQPPAPAASREPNIFTEVQENDLGDAVAERFEPYLRIIEDEALTRHLTSIGQRLVRRLPPTQLRVRFALVDLPEANAFVLPGGRVYVSRKLVGFTRTEDELAAVLSHELGHLIARQQTVEMTARLNAVIGVTAVGDRKDIFDKYNRLMDNAARKPGAFTSGDSHAGKDQLEADRLGLFVAAAAGYDPQAHVRLYDRFAETKGRTGSFLSTLFGTTSPESKRLGDMIKGTAALPPGCADTRHAADTQAFIDWQASVLSFTGGTRTESLQAVSSRTALSPRLRGEVIDIHFSPDGRYLLAEDDTGVSILTREPFESVFRIDSALALEPHFTPDSREIVFHTSDLRIERWSITARKLVEVHDLVMRKRCLRTVLAPDGRTFACLDSNLDLSVIDVATTALIAQKKEFFRLDPRVASMLDAGLIEPMTAMGGSLMNLGFSTDGRFLVAGYKGLGTAEALFVYDFQSHAPLTIKGAGRKLMMGSFAFIGPDRLVASNPEDETKSGIVSLPGGEIVEPFTLAGGRFTAPVKPGYLIIRPFQKYLVGVMDLAKHVVVKGLGVAAIDLYGDVFVAERGTGELGLYAIATNALLKATLLPPTAFGSVTSASVSPDFKYVAVSDRTRGAVWDVTNGRRVVEMRGFRGGHFAEDGAVYADFPKAGAETRALIKIDPRVPQASRVSEITDRNVTKVGGHLLVRRPLPPNVIFATGEEYEMRDAMRGTTLWKRSFPTDPPLVWTHDDSSTVGLIWYADSPAGREVIRQDPNLRKTVKLGELAGDYVVEFVSQTTGATLTRLLLETGKGSFRPVDMFTTADWVVVSDSIGRVLIYSLATGDLKGHAFGSAPVVGARSNLLAVEGGAGKLLLYDLTTMERRNAYTFADGITMKSFSPDGKRLFVLTTAQTAYVLDVTSAPAGR
jgi:WD40 repeat protein